MCEKTHPPCNQQVSINTSVKTFEKLAKYKDLDIEIAKSWKCKTKTIPVVIGALGVINKTPLPQAIPAPTAAAAFRGRGRGCGRGGGSGGCGTPKKRKIRSRAQITDQVSAIKTHTFSLKSELFWRGRRPVKVWVINYAF